MDEASLSRAVDFMADAYRFAKEAMRALDRGNAIEAERFAEFSRKSALAGANELRRET